MDAPRREGSAETPDASPQHTPPPATLSVAGAVWWVSVGRYGNYLFGMIVLAVLARLLTPADFGLIAMVAVLSGFLQILADAGVSSAIVQHDALTPAQLNTVFLVSLLTGALVGVVVALAAPWIASFYGDQALVPILYVSALNSLFIALGKVPSGLLERDLRFDLIARADLLAGLCSGLLALGVALSGGGYWALLARDLSLCLLRSVLRLRASRWRPTASFAREGLGEVLGFSGHVTSFTMLNYWARNADNLLIGRLYGSSALGFYSRAYALMLYPLELFTATVNPVLHPTLARLFPDREAMLIFYTKVLRLIASLCIPVMAGLAVMAPETVLLIWGDAWGPSVPIFGIFCVIGAFQPLLSTSGAVFQATDRADLLLRVGGLNALVLVTGIILGMPHGVRGVAVSYSLAYALIFLPTFYVVFTTLLGGSLRTLGQLIWRPLVIAGLLVVVLTPIKQLWSPGWHVAARFGLGVLCCAILYVGALRMLDPDLFAQLLGFLRTRVLARLKRARAS